MVSLLNILNISYSWIQACFLALFTSVVPSWVISRMSHISFVDAHCETLKNSSEFKAEMIIFLAMQSDLTLLLSLSVHWDQGFSMKTSYFSSLGSKGPFLIASQIPLSIDSTSVAYVAERGGIERCEVLSGMD